MAHGDGTLEGIAKRLLSVVTALAFFATNIELCYANGLTGDSYPEYGPAARADTAAMLLLRVPFGGQSQTLSQPTLNLSLGSFWREAPGSLSASSVRFVPAMELGVTLRGEPSLRLGSVDAVQELSSRISAQGDDGEGWSADTWLLILLGGVATAGIIYGLTIKGPPKSCKVPCPSYNFPYNCPIPPPGC
jgi:hypothetical protein